MGGRMEIEETLTNEERLERRAPAVGDEGEGTCRVVISVPLRVEPSRTVSNQHGSSSDKVLVWIRIQARNNTLMI
jgi:hypothetical protein